MARASERAGFQCAWQCVPQSGDCSVIYIMWNRPRCAFKVRKALDLTGVRRRESGLQASRVTQSCAHYSCAPALDSPPLTCAPKCSPHASALSGTAYPVHAPPRPVHDDCVMHQSLQCGMSETQRATRSAEPASPFPFLLVFCPFQLCSSH